MFVVCFLAGIAENLYDTLHFQDIQKSSCQRSLYRATLKNGEKVNINRNYLNGVKKALGGDKEE